MHTRAITTVLAAAGLLLVVLLAPVAASPVPPSSEVRSERLSGLPRASNADEMEVGALAVPAEPGLGAGAGAQATPSRPVQAPLPFSLLAFEVPDGAAVWFRTSTDGERWTLWESVHVHPEEGPDPGNVEDPALPGREYSAPVWVGEASWLQVSVAGAGPEDVPVHLIDSLGLHRSPLQQAVDAVRASWSGWGSPSPALAEVDRPQIITRSQWGANESWRKGNAGIARRARAGFVHHTVNSNSYTQDQAAGLVRGIYHYHTQIQGWWDIGYNFLIDRYGRIYEGRAGGLEKAVIGAHAGGFNTGSVGIALLGDFRSAAPPAVAEEALADLLAWVFDVHHIDATGTVQMTSAGSTRYSSGTQVTLNTISGHRDVSATACPGNGLYNRLSALRQAAANRAKPMFVDPEASTYRVRMADAAAVGGPVRFTTRLKPSGSWTFELRDPDGGIVHQVSGSGSQAAASWEPKGQSGRYTWSFRASGRRTATGTLDLLIDVLDRVGTAGDVPTRSVQLARAAFPHDNSASHAVVARDDVFADAMAGGPLAGTDGPLLLTRRDALSPAVEVELERVLPSGGTVYLLGGEAALSSAVASALDARWEVRRLAGPERTATAAEVAKVVRARSGSATVMLARAGPDDAAPWADALAGGAYGAKHGIPVLLTYTDELARPTSQALGDVDRVIVLGGRAAVSDEVLGQLPNPRRVAGAERAETATAIAAELWGRTSGSGGDHFLIGNGYASDAWALALAASPLAAREQAPLLLTNRQTLPPATPDYLGGLGYRSDRHATGWVLGGTGAVSEGILDELARRMQ